MIENRVISLHVDIACLQQLKTEIHIVVGNRQTLVHASHFLIFFPQYHQAGARHRRHIVGNPVSAEIVILLVGESNEFMGRTDFQIGDTCMLDVFRTRIPQLRPDGSHMGQKRLSCHTFQPASLYNFYVIVHQKNQIALRLPFTQIAHL